MRSVCCVPASNIKKQQSIPQGIMKVMARVQDSESAIATQW
jgi:hypothetical protein